MRMLLKLLPQFVHFASQLDDYVRQRVADVLGIGNDNALAVAQHNMPGHAHNRGIGGYAAQHDRACAHAAVIANRYVAQQLGSRSHCDVIAKGRMSLALLFSGSTQRYSLIQRDIVPNDGGLADHGAHAVIDKEASSNLSAGMNLNAGEKARDLRSESRQKTHAMNPQPVAQMVSPHSMQARIADQHLEVRASRGVRLKDGGDIFSDRADETGHGKFSDLFFS